MHRHTVVVRPKHASLRSGRRLLVAALMLVLCACKAPGPVREGDVQIAPVRPDDAPTFTLASNQRFIFGRPIADRRAMPVYPAGALSARLPPVSVCVELETDAHGRVTAARPVRVAGACEVPPDALHADGFQQAVHDAVMTWRYLPSLLCTGVSRAEPQDPDNCGSATAQAMPLLRAYRFVFTQRDGEPAVGMGDVANR